MASEFQRKKVATVFSAMDRNGRGHLVENDFVALADRWTVLRDADPGSDEWERLRRVMTGWWASLSAAARDPERVHLDDVMAVVDVLPQMTDEVTATADAMFEAVDENRDGLISRAEYRQLIEAWNGRTTDTDAVFDRLTGNSFITQDEFRDLWTQFWAGDDPEAPGTWVFGRFQTAG